HTRLVSDWSSDGCSSDLVLATADAPARAVRRMGYSPDGKYLWMASGDSMTVADGATGRAIKTWPIEGNDFDNAAFGPGTQLYVEIGRASCRERGEGTEGG